MLISMVAIASILAGRGSALWPYFVSKSGGAAGTVIDPVEGSDR